MSTNRFWPLEVLVERIFDGPLTSTYLIMASVTAGLGAYLAYWANELPDTVRALAMMATLLGLARLCEARPMRWAWVGLMGLLSLVPLLDLLRLLV